MNEKEIDYLQYTNPIPEPIDSTEWVEIKPIPYYKRGYEHKSGHRQYFGAAKSDRALSILSGSTLHNFRAAGISIPEFIARQLSAGCKFSRVDLCVTQYVDEDLITPDDFIGWHIASKVLGKFADATPKFFSSIDEKSAHAETIYFGDLKKRGKRGIVRVYDKGVELDLGKYLITRIELEEKRDNAHATAKRLADGVPIASLIRAKFDVSDDRWGTLMEEPAADLSRGQAKNKSEHEAALDARWQWLIDTVAKSLADATYEDALAGRGDRIEKFENAVRGRLRELTQV